MEDFIEPLLTQLKRLGPEDESAALPLEYEIVQDLQQPETSNSIVSSWVLGHCSTGGGR